MSIVILEEMVLVQADAECKRPQDSLAGFKASPVK